MATVNKDFKIKSGLIVEGTTATVNGYDLLKKSPADDNYIIDLIGGETLVKSVEGTQLEVNGAGKLSVKAEVFDDFGSATDAQAAAESFATSADTAVRTAVTTEIGTAKSEAISAAALDATAKANQAYTDAVSDAADDATTKANNAETFAISTAAADATAKANAAEAAAALDATAKADAAEAAAALDATAKADAAEAAAILAANGYTDVAEGREQTNRNNAISNAISDLNLANSYDSKGSAAQALVDSKAYTDQEVSALVDSAPELLDTLNELAAAIADNPNYATDAANAVAGRVAKSGDTMTGALTLSGAPTVDLHAATKGYVDAEITSAGTAAQDAADAALESANDYTDSAIATEVTSRNSAIGTAKSEAGVIAQGYADTAEQDAKDYTDLRETAITTAYESYADQAEVDAKAYTDTRETAITTAYQTYADQAEADAKDYADALDTDDVAEAGSLYFTDARAKSSAADLLTGASLTNITITGTGAGLVITAENGVADSTTDDLAEGEDNLYFTDERAVAALEAVVPRFTSVELNSVALQVASTLTAPIAGVQVANAFTKANFRSAEYLVKVAYGSHTEISKVLLTLDTSDNIAITEYGIVGTNGSASTISAAVNGPAVELLVTTTNNNSTVTVMGTLLK